VPADHSDVVGILVTIALYTLLAYLGQLIHECAHGLVVARHTGRRVAVRSGLGPHLIGLRLGPLDVDVRVVAIRDTCLVDFDGVPVTVVRRALWAGPLADVAQAVAFLFVIAAGGPAGLAWAIVTSCLWRGGFSLLSRSGLRWGMHYESDGFKLRALTKGASIAVAPAAEPAPDSLVDYLRCEAPQLLGADGTPVAAAAPVAPAAAAPAVAAPAAPAAPADPLLAYLQETAPELVATVTDERRPAQRPVDPRAATSIAPPGMR
jgi:hypothetical protein